MLTLLPALIAGESYLTRLDNRHQRQETLLLIIQS
jgi:hypothetical protein